MREVKPHILLSVPPSLRPSVLPSPLPGPSAHLIGIGGSGMSALAEVLVDQGWRVTGSDLAEHAANGLPTRGVHVFQGHTAEHVARDVSIVVYSDAVGRDNVERRRAGELGIPQVNYPAMLGELMTGRIGLAVAGTHGKSTTTALAEAIMVTGGLDPTVIGGGAPLGRMSGGHGGRGRHLLVEACEYRRNFLQLSPHAAVITGIEADHFDCFASLDEVLHAFGEFVCRLPIDGLLLVHAGCPASYRIGQQAPCRVATFGINVKADWRAEALVQHGGRYTFDIFGPAGRIAGLTLPIPGRHNVLNALGAAALANYAGADNTAIRRGLGRFAGLRRRLEHVGKWRGALWYDDYAHHPTEVTASLATLRQMFPQRRLWCMFQPHQKRRTQRLLDEFAASLQNADRVAVAEVFPARETADVACREIAARLIERTRALGAEVIGEPGLVRLAELVGETIAPGDVLVTMGAGDIRNVWDGIDRRIRSYRAAG
jgi:UDP-N-acetylmuramate--alanine ligase